MTEDIETVAFRVTGRVQGVGFRAWTQSEAEARSLSGWVRNEPDGAVAGTVSGPVAAVHGMLGALRRGPRLAEVRDLETGPGEPVGQEGFRILR